MSVVQWEDGKQTEALLRSIEGGDEAALDALLEMYRPDLLQFVAFRLSPRLRTRADEFDIVQDTLQEAHRRIRDYLERRPMPFRLWLLRIALDRLLMARRRHIKAARRTVVREALISDESSVNVFSRLFARGSTPSAKLRKAEMIDSVREALGALGEADREIVFLRVMEDMPYRDIGLLLDLSEQAARQRFGRALARLSQVLASLGFSPHDTLP